MKKIISVLLSLMLLVALAAPVAADGSATMRLSASSGTVHRGDSFTVTVILDNDQEVGRGGIVLSYDSSVFEFVGGSCNVSGATLAEVSAGRNGGVFALAENRVVSGTIFTIQMQVKSNAEFGKYTISGTASMDISCNVRGTTVTVACDHSYGAYVKAGDNHSRTCSVCGYEDVSGHSWNSGEVTVSATCTTSGEKLFTCTDCGATTTETIAPNDNHKFNNWTLSNDYTHYGTCTVCGETYYYNHNWEYQGVTQAATCVEKGIETWICTSCDGKSTEELPLADHEYGECVAVDAETHQYLCVHCGQGKEYAHVFTNQYTHDAQGHRLTCDECGYAQEREDHVPGPEATDTTSQDCEVCGRLLKVALNHIHVYKTEWSSDAQGHWNACEFCDDQTQREEHTYTSVCDATCDTCGYVRVAPHDYADVLNGDTEGHYYPCRGCGAKKDSASHTPGAAATVSAAQTCTACGWEIAPKLAHEHDYTGTTGMHCHVCDCGEVYPVAEDADCQFCQEQPAECDHFPWWIVCIVEGVLLIIALILLMLPRRKRKSKGKSQGGRYIAKTNQDRTP